MSEKEIFKRNGRVFTDSQLISFLYELLRDHVSPGVLEKIVQDGEANAERYWEIAHALSNGWIAGYAEDIAARLTSCDGKETKKELTNSLGTIANEWRNLAAGVSAIDDVSATTLRKCANELQQRIGKSYE